MQPDICNSNSTKQKHIFCLKSFLIFLKYNFYPCSKTLNWHKGQKISNLDHSVLMSRPSIIQLILVRHLYHCLPCSPSLQPSCSPTHPSSALLPSLVIWSTAHCSHLQCPPYTSPTKTCSILQVQLIHLEPRLTPLLYSLYSLHFYCINQSFTIEHFNLCDFVFPLLLESLFLRNRCSFCLPTAPFMMTYDRKSKPTKMGGPRTRFIIYT